MSSSSTNASRCESKQLAPNVVLGTACSSNAISATYCALRKAARYSSLLEVALFCTQIALNLRSNLQKPTARYSLHCVGHYPNILLAIFFSFSFCFLSCKSIRSESFWMALSPSASFLAFTISCLASSHRFFS